MKHIRSYLTFSGNCREAMNFYRECLDGELKLQTIGDSPLADKMPENMHKWILHATLTNGSTVLMGTDMVPEEGRIRGNALSMMLDCDSETEARSAFEALSSEGNVLHPLETSFWGALFGDLKDKYGNTWLIHFDRNS